MIRSTVATPISELHGRSRGCQDRRRGGVDRHQRADRRRRAGRPDARARPRLARHRRHRRRELRQAGEPPNVKCNQVSARSMEVFRRLGLADKIRDTGLPAEFRNDVSCCVSATGKELSRIKLPSRAGRVRGEKGDDGWWPTPEPPHRVNQFFLEPVLFAHAAAQPRIRILNRTQFEEFTQDADGVTATARSRQRRAHHDHLPLSGRLRRRPLDGAPGDRRHARRHAGRSARAVDLFPRAGIDRPAAGRAGLDVSRVQSAALRHHDGDRRPGNLAHPQFPLQRRAGIRFGRSRLGDPRDPRRRRRSSNTRSSPRRTGSAGVWSPIGFATAAPSSAAMPRICGFPMPATA